MENVLICQNSQCRFLVDFRRSSRNMSHAELIIQCPECKHPWSRNCPLCVRPLLVVWRNKVPCCSHCGEEL